MRNLFYLIFRFSAFLTFVVLEFLCFYLIVNYNKSQSEIWQHSSSLLSGNVFSQVQKAEDFFRLQAKNDSLLLENAQLLQTILNYRLSSENNSFQDFELAQSDSAIQYQLIPANVCAKTVNLRNNSLTLSKGSNHGIKKGMGVISDKGVVGIIKAVSHNYSTVLMILHSQSRISSKILNKNYHGNMIWESSDPRLMKLLDVPKHATIELGDTLVTSGYSVSFPPLVEIGTISKVDILEGSNSFDIEVLLNYDLSNTEKVYIVDMKSAYEKEQILPANE